MVVRFWIIIVPLQSRQEKDVFQWTQWQIKRFSLLRCRKRKGTEYKGLGTVLSMDCRRHVQTDVGTWLDTENACRKDGLHPAVHIQGVEREKEYVVGNHLQD